jgi:hypothetical protein
MKNIIPLLCMLVCAAVSSFAQQQHISAISMSRTPCFGKCKVYTVTVDENGSVLYEGKIFVKYKGLYQKQLGKKGVAGFFKSVEQYHIDTCQNKYESDMMDGPELNYVITYQYGQKEIVNAQIGPEFLLKISEKIDALAKVDKTWKKLKK